MIFLLKTNEDSFLVSAPNYKLLLQKCEDMFGAINAKYENNKITLTGVDVFDNEQDYVFNESESFAVDCQRITNIDQLEELLAQGFLLEKCYE